MAGRNKTTAEPTSNRPGRRPAITPEAEEAHMISLATSLAEKQLMDGTAKSQVIVHYLRLATVQKQLELEKLREENKLLRAKTEAIESAKDVKELYANAIAAMQLYQGRADD